MTCDELSRPRRGVPSDAVARRAVLAGRPRGRAAFLEGAVWRLDRACCAASESRKTLQKVIMFASQSCSTRCDEANTTASALGLANERALLGARRAEKRPTKDASGGAKGSAGGRRAPAQAFTEVEQASTSLKQPTASWRKLRDQEAESEGATGKLRKRVARRS